VPEDLDVVLQALRPLLLDLDHLVRAVAAGRRRGTSPRHRRAELRPVDLKAGRRLQLVTTDAAPTAAPVTSNLTGEQAPAAVDALLAEPFGNWLVETDRDVRQLRVTKKGQAQVHVAASSRRDVEPRTGHDRVKTRLLDPADPLFDALGADADKRRQVDAFLRLLAPVTGRAVSRAREAGRPLRVVDLGCGNAYLTFAAHRFLAAAASVDIAAGAGTSDVRTVGVDQRPDMVARNAALAERLGMEGLHFVTGTIENAPVDLTSPATLPEEVDVVLALHACDTATDDALARAVAWRAPVVLAAPCCHHDVQRRIAAAQAAGHPAPHPYQALTRHGILRERFADVLTDALRAALLRLLGYRVDVVEFVDSRHTPRNAMIRAEHTGAPPDDDRLAEYRDLVASWSVTPRLAELLARLQPDDRDLVARIDTIVSPSTISS
jgi:SAM-dependent methyltransferase